MDNSLTKEFNKELNYLNFYHTALRNITQMTLIGFTILVIRRYHSEKKNKAYEIIFLFLAFVIFALSLYEISILDKQIKIIFGISKNQLYTSNLIMLPKMYALLMLIVEIYIIYSLVKIFF